MRGRLSLFTVRINSSGDLSSSGCRFADPVAVPGEHGAPGEGAERGEPGKHAESHADDARRDGDQVADDGEKARKKDPGHFITLQEKFRLLHLVGGMKKNLPQRMMTGRPTTLATT